MAKNGTGKSRKPAASPRPKDGKVEPDPSAQGPTEPTNRPRALTVVGIGASAGGLAALRSFFNALPSDTGMAYVVITHLHPEHESHMAELLQQNTAMPAVQVNQKIEVEPDHVYVIPPNRSILMADGYLDAVEFTEPHGMRTPIDHFYRSLARGHSESIAVILSGGGTDGSVGVKDIKEQGGLILVQHPNDAEYDSMPRAAINTGLADVVLPASELAEKLAHYSRHRPQIPHDPGELSERETETLQRILSQVHARTGHDFNQYKRSTILRRVERRMQLNGFTTLEAYLDFLRHNATEATAMFNDILIGVTNFFRDRDSWLALETKVIPALLGNPHMEDGIRVWSIGCATGEEAYSLAILLFEAAARQDFRPHIQIFASDLDDASIAYAREGHYPAAIEADVSPKRLDRFFTREGEYYRVNRELRDAVLFTSHNALRDPPFSRQDLIACRNVLIYLEREVQANVFDIFHYALNPGGYLFLGVSESAEQSSDLFDIVDKTHRIFRARPWLGDRPHMPHMPLTLARGIRPTERPGGARLRSFPFLEASPAHEHQRALESSAPPSIIIDDRGLIVHVSETAGRYLLQPKGPITGDVLKLVRPELQLELRTTIFRAFDKNRATFGPPISVHFNGQTHRVILAVRPYPETTLPTKAHERQALVVFLEDELEEALEPPKTEASGHLSEAENNAMVSRLEAEVQRLREQLQITIEEYDSSNEEMKAANEELQSMNEEYRSATEELETSKEELQSVNEELQTVNTDMRNKLDELARAHEELENLLGATETGILFLDRELRIQRFTGGMNALFNIMPGDRGRPIRHLTHKLKYNRFTDDAESVLRTLVPIELEVETESGGWYLLSLRPYRSTEDKVQGVVISFVDIQKLKQAEQQIVRNNETLEERVTERTGELDQANTSLTQARDLFRSLFRANPIPTALNDVAERRYMDVNDAFLEFLGFNRDQVIGRTSGEIGLVGSPERRQALAEQLLKVDSVKNFEQLVKASSGETKTVLVSVDRLTLDGREMFLTAFTDITPQKAMEESLRALLDAAPDPTVIVNEAGRIVRINKQLEDTLGYTRKDLLGQPIERLIPKGFHDLDRGHRAGLASRPEARPIGPGAQLFALRSDGSQFPVEISLSPLETAEGPLVIASIRDITERVRADEKIRMLATTLTEAEQQERLRISQILHDDLQQRLFAIKSQLSLLNAARKQKTGKGFQNELSEIEDALSDSIAITRSLTMDLSPAILEGEGLAEAVVWLANTMRRQHDLDVTVQTDSVPTNFEKNLRVLLFQAVRELLFNVVKHSGTLRAKVKFERSGDLIRITVSDGGQGFDVQSVLDDPVVSHGLLSIRHRLGLLGCNLELRSKPGKGTRAVIECPADRLVDAQ